MPSKDEMTIKDSSRAFYSQLVMFPESKNRAYMIKEGFVLGAVSQRSGTCWQMSLRFIREPAIMTMQN